MIKLFEEFNIRKYLPKISIKAPERPKLEIAYWKLKKGDFRVLNKFNIDQLIELRKISRDNKDYRTSDIIRDFLDDKNVFIFDIKDDNGNPMQEVRYLYDEYFTEYPKGYVEDSEGFTKEEKEKKAKWKEYKKNNNYMQHIENMIDKKFRNKRAFVEYMMQKDIKANRNLDAWIYSNASPEHRKLIDSKKSGKKY
jgi:hypothetical protein